ncbi:MAG: hypothetical protein WD314_06255 [Trueperaceae bacterium]
MTDDRQQAAGTGKRSSAEIRSQIVATRARLASDIDAARMKLSRRGLEHEAMSAIRGVRHEASGAMSGFSTSTDRQMSQLSHLAVDTVKRYPLVTTLVGIGLALLAFSNGRRAGPHVDSTMDSEAPFVRPTARTDLPPTDTGAQR